MNVKTNILDKIFIIMLISVFFTNGIMKILNFDQTIKWVESYNYPSELVYIGIFVETQITRWIDCRLADK